MESKKINQLATELTPSLSDLTIIGDPSTGISKKITLSQMASLFTGTVEEYASLAAFPLVGVADTIYIALDTNVLYRWNTGTNAYVELSPNIINSLVFNDANGFDGTISLVGSVATLTITTALTTGSVGFIGASGALLQDNANFFWDDTNNRLGIGTNAPTTAIDTFGSGIITRVNGTSTNNAFIGFASAGTNKWSIGNVQSDHRFRIYNDATTSELVSVLQTGEFGIGIANPTTKLHIDGGASALIANLDANVSVAKSISFRSDNSNRINLEVSGTESGSNVGADLFVRTYTDLGALIETPLSIVRSTGVTTIKSLTLTNALSIANGGTGSTTQNFVDLTTTQSIGGAKTFTSALAGTSAAFSGAISAGSNISYTSGSAFYPRTTTVTDWFLLKHNSASDRIDNALGLNQPFTIGSYSGTTYTPNIFLYAGGAATFSGDVLANTKVLINTSDTTKTRLLLNAEGNYSTSGNMTSGLAITNGSFGRALNMGIFESGAYGWIQAAYVNNADTTFALALQPRGGNVLIGTTTDIGFKLQVAGNCRIQDTLSVANGDSGQAIFTNNSTAVSVSTTTALGSSFAMGGNGAFVIVYGASGSNIFIDTIVSANSGTPTVISSTTVSGSPSARTYSTGSNRLQLAMASGTYEVRINILRQT
jgi:hypothetical protein